MVIVKEAKGIEKVLNSQSFSNEEELERILAAQPSLMIDEGEPTVTLVQRQLSVEGVGTADLLLVDATGLPMVVEVKLARNGESRRKVVGQIFDYVSALTLLTVDELDQRVSGALEKAMINLIEQENTSIETIWQACGNNLRAGKARVVVAFDEAPDELVRILRFLNDHSDLDVRLVEIKQYTNHEGAESFYVPRLIIHGGEISIVKHVQGPVSEDVFFNSLDQYGKPVYEALTNYAKSHSLPIHYGSKGISINIDLDGKHISLFYCYHPTAVYKQTIYTDFFRKDSQLSRIISNDDILNIIVPIIQSARLFRSRRKGI